jgi:Family of unknown function (DUF5681)
VAQFQPGQSGNPGGQPKGLAEVKAAARTYTAQAMAVLAANLEHDNAKVRESAAIALLDRGWGKPAQTIGGDAEMEAIQQTVRVIFGRD